MERVELAGGAVRHAGEEIRIDVRQELLRGRVACNDVVERNEQALAGDGGEPFDRYLVDVGGLPAAVWFKKPLMYSPQEPSGCHCVSTLTFG